MNRTKKKKKEQVKIFLYIGIGTRTIYKVKGSVRNSVKKAREHNRRNVVDNNKEMDISLNVNVVLFSVLIIESPHRFAI